VISQERCAKRLTDKLTDATVRRCIVELWHNILPRPQKVAVVSPVLFIGWSLCALIAL
jgi:hypothetical protein